MKCVLCRKEIDVQLSPFGEVVWTGGHNAEPIKSGRCCSTCNATRVIPARLENHLSIRITV